jgi:hypothetical protein
MQINSALPQKKNSQATFDPWPSGFQKCAGFCTVSESSKLHSRERRLACEKRTSSMLRANMSEKFERNRQKFAGA